MGPIELSKKMINIGVPEDMPPEEAKHIRFLNTYGLAIFPPSIFFLAYAICIVIFFKVPASFILVSLTLLMAIAAVLLMNRHGFYKSARNCAIVFSNLYFVYLYFYLGKGTIFYYSFSIFAGLAAILYPKKESFSMYLMIALSIIFFAAMKIYGDDYARAILSPMWLKQVNSMMAFQTLFGVIIVTLAARYSMIGAEDRLLESRKQIAALTAKLRVYLPRQFVESLARGERSAEQDYKRRRLTIFFSDVHGFTAFTDRLEPEDVQRVLNQYLSEMSAIADKWGGTIDKFIGDAVMIFFGDPEFTSDRDHALRCVRMAMEMQEKMKALRAEWEDRGHLEPLHIRIGINTGYATVGNFGSQDRLNYTILGSAVNLASRLETICRPDKITISHMTWALIKGEIKCEPKDEIEVKGFSEPMKIYEVVG